jgi:hypothetical protein
MAQSQKQIIEISLYWNEDVIFAERIRNTLAYADFFYVAEGNESHSGLIQREHFHFPKLLADLCAEDTSIDPKRVIFIPVDLSKSDPSPVVREKLVRDAALNQVFKDRRLSPDNILIISDFDEFFHPSGKSELLNYFSGFQFWRKVLRLKYRMTYYKLNLVEQNSIWDLVLAMKGSVAMKPGFSPNFYRHDIRKKAFPTSKKFLGWHHSYLGDSKKVLEKIKSFAAAFDTLIQETPEKDILDRLAKGEDLYGRKFNYQKMDYQKLQGIPALLGRSDLLG